MTGVEARGSEASPTISAGLMLDEAARRRLITALDDLEGAKAAIDALLDRPSDAAA